MKKFFLLFLLTTLAMLNLDLVYADMPASPGYLISPGDVLEISVWKEEELQRSVLVRPDGGISFPLVGNVSAKGKTIDELQQEISNKLAKYIPNPAVSVSVQELKGNVIYVIGKVNKPGQYPIGQYVDVMQAISLAGGLTPFADENDIKVLRRKNGKTVVYPFEYNKVIAGKKLEQNILLQPGDTVMVPD